VIRAIAVDDEHYNLEELCALIGETGFVRVLGRYQNPLDALREAPALAPQAAFIDIEMPEMDGLTLAEKLLEINPAMKIVFITGWNQYAVAAFELSALDYLMKPLNKARFDKMLSRLRGELAPGPAAAPSLDIRCFGGFDVLVGGEPVVWHRTKAEELFAFLLMHHSAYLHKDFLLENLWPEYERAKSLPILQTSVCRIRSVLSPCGDRVRLNYAGSRYGLFLSGAHCDYLRAEEALRGFDPRRRETCLAVLDACEQLQRGLIPQSGYLWSMDLEEDLRRRCIAALTDMAPEQGPGEALRARAEALLLRLNPADEAAR